MLRPHCSADSDCISANWGHLEQGAQSGCKNPLACLCVCLSVCLRLALLPFNVNRFWRNLVTRTLLWSSLAATIMVQIGCRGTTQRLFENFKTFSKITEFEFQNSGPSFLAYASPVYCKKIRLDSNKTDGGDRFWSLPLWHCCSSTTLGGIFWLNRQRGGVQRPKLGGIRNWGCNRAVKTNRLVILYLTVYCMHV